MNDRIWEKFYTIPQKMFSFHATRPVLLVRGLVLFVLGLLGLYNPTFVLTVVTMVIGGVLLLFAVASFLMAWRSGRGSTALLLLFVALGAVGAGLLIVAFRTKKQKPAAKSRKKPAAAMPRLRADGSAGTTDGGEDS